MSCYNADRWLEESIQSVVNQTFTNWEFLLIDDGSTDESWSIIKKYHKKDNRIVPIKKNNTGLADSLNLGIARANGSWIARLDADDLCEPTRLDEQFRFVKKHPEIGLVGSWIIELDENGKIIKTHKYPSSHSKLVRNIERGKAFIHHSTAFYDTKIVREIGGYNLRIKLAEDMRLWLKISAKWKIGCIDKPLVRVRKHSMQISVEKSGLPQILDGTLSQICHFLQIAGFPDPCAEYSDAEWLRFNSWAEKRLKEEGYFEICQFFFEDRKPILSSNNKLNETIRLIKKLIEYGHITPIIWMKFFGSAIGKQLALEWMKTAEAKMYRIG
jgi:glycosyltransferase involved in cell wall biosynthesis